MVLRVCLVLLALFNVVLCADRRHCASQSDCRANECCLNNSPPRGRRFLADAGHCTPLGEQGRSCYVNFGSAATPPPNIVNACPCHSPLTCIGKHMFEVPLGEIGSCG